MTLASASRDPQPFVIHEGLIEDNRTNGLRSGEGSVVELRDGSLLILYGQFTGSSDEDPAVLVTRRSRDGGVTWSDRAIFITAPSDALNVMSASLLRLQDGRIAALYLIKFTMENCRPYFVTSSDEGRTWSSPITMVPEPEYFAINNDRLVQLKSGRLLAPYHRYPGRRGEGHCGCLISDDAGNTWRRSERDVFLTPERVRKPRHVLQSNAEVVQVVEAGDIHVREPGVIELSDGCVLMWCRSTGSYVYRSISRDGGLNWSLLEAIPELTVPSSPQSVCRLPSSRRLVMFLNERGDISYGHEQFHWRRPLSVAVSDDEGQTWKLLGELTTDAEATACYTSICPHRGALVLTYYQGVMQTHRDGVYRPRPLASLAIKVVRQDWFAS